MAEMRLEEQIQRLQEMKDYLGDFCRLMRETMDDLQNDIKFLRSQGFSVETEQTYQTGYYNPANENVEEVIHNVYTRHYDYLDYIIEQLKEALNER